MKNLVLLEALLNSGRPIILLSDKLFKEDDDEEEDSLENSLLSKPSRKNDFKVIPYTA